LSVCFSAAVPSFFFLEIRRVSGAEFSELLIKHGLGRDNWKFDVKNRWASDETDSLVSARAEESSHTRGAGKRSGTDHRATGFHYTGTIATQDFHAAIFRCDS
jgi:hypothetical protein